MHAFFEEALNSVAFLFMYKKEDLVVNEPEHIERVKRKQIIMCFSLSQPFFFHNAKVPDLTGHCVCK